MLFGRRRAPEWSALHDRRTHDELVELVRSMVREAELTFDEDDDGRVVRLGGGATLDLGDLSAAAAEVGPEAWPDIVRDRLASATNPNRAPTDPARLRPAVRVRVMTREALGRFPKQLPHRAHGDLAEVLVIDSARSLVWADERDLEPLGSSLDGLFILGRENVRAHEPVTTSVVELDRGPATLVRGDHPYVASWAVMLDELVALPAAGAAVVVPTTRTVLLRALEGPADADSLDDLVVEATAHHRAGPGALTPRPHRWHGGRLGPLP